MRILEKTLAAFSYVGITGYTLWFIYKLIVPIFTTSPLTIGTVAFALIITLCLIPLWGFIGYGVSMLLAATGFIVGIIAEGIAYLIRHYKCE